jgi:hypothetical protein
MVDFIKTVTDKIRSSRSDAIVFDSMDSNGVTRSYTAAVSTGALDKARFMHPIQYFHPVKKRIVKSVMFNDIDENRDIFAFYSKKITNSVFGESVIHDTLIKHDIV